MKKLLRSGGIVLVICAVLLFLASGSLQEGTKPNEVKIGYVQDGQFVETDRGEIGGNPEGYEWFSSLKAVGVMAGIAGGVAVLASFAIKEE